ncbi:MAG: DUF4157 domain-containing protein, partial [Planctomycetota bacterium]
MIYAKSCCTCDFQFNGMFSFAAGRWQILIAIWVIAGVFPTSAALSQDTDVPAVRPDDETPANQVEKFEIPLGPRCTLIINDIDAAKKTLTTEDTFTRQLSQFDLQARLGTTRDDVGLKDLFKAITSSLRPMSNKRREAFQNAAQQLAKKIEQLKVKLPPTISLVITDSTEEEGTAYTRGNVIVLHEPDLRMDPVKPNKLLAHELFHVISRSNPNLKDKMYGIIGFRHVGLIQMEPTLKDKRLTNPDAPTNEHIIDLKISEDKTVAVTPVLFANRPISKNARPGSVMPYVGFELMKVEKNADGKFVAIRTQPPVTTPSNPDFFRQIGRNTMYIIDPEEILADNFADWAIDAPDGP